MSDRYIRLAILDVDGTLKQAESPYSYLHERLGYAEQGEANRTLASTGQIDYGEWLARDVVLWAGRPVAYVRQLLDENPYVPGAPEFLRALKAAGVVVALVSAGFTLNTDPIMEEFGLDYALANELKVVDGRLDGTALNHVPEGGKGAFVRELIDRLGVPRSAVLAAGDTRGDVELFEQAGVCIAVNPVYPPLREAATVVFERDLIGAVDWMVEHGYLPPHSRQGEHRE